jgi:hypothetical protein
VCHGRTPRACEDPHWCRREPGQLVHLFQDPLAQICQVIVLSQPTAFDTIQADAPLNRPIAAGFSALSGTQDMNLRCCWCAQESPVASGRQSLEPTVWIRLARSGRADGWSLQPERRSSLSSDLPHNCSARTGPPAMAAGWPGVMALAHRTRPGGSSACGRLATHRSMLPRLSTCRHRLFSPPFEPTS